jgi:hypothetical protein
MKPLNRPPFPRFFFNEIIIAKNVIVKIKSQIIIKVLIKFIPFEPNPKELAVINEVFKRKNA